MTSVPFWGFSGCVISELTIPEGITSIGEGAFNSNSTLTALYLPSTVENISTNAFGGCNNLSDVYFNGTQAEAEAILIGTGNTYLSSATWHCSDGDSEGIGATSGTCGSSHSSSGDISKSFAAT